MTLGTFGLMAWTAGKRAAAAPKAAARTWTVSPRRTACRQWARLLTALTPPQLTSASSQRCGGEKMSGALLIDDQPAAKPMVMAQQPLPEQNCVWIRQQPLARAIYVVCVASFLASIEWL